MMKIDHTFAICAYKESEFLEDCIQSLKNQTVQTNIIMATSTPNDFIKNMAAKYDIPLYVRDGKSDIRDDWNFAYNQAKTEWVTIAHQDDEYNEHYVEEMCKKLEGVKNPIAFVTDYIPIKNGQIGPRDINSKIRRFLRKPLKYNKLAGTRFWKREILSLGNTICCPSVTYYKKVLGDSFFTSELKFNIDWDTFLKFSEIPGVFAYVEKPLTYYRVHDGATSKEFIVDHKRVADDTFMFQKFWPNWMVKIIMHFYKRAYDTYN
ncbi:glycosyltransferase family 2 protein [Roseburia sp. MUC/MUC-530-WT-4D]|uniref:Glycosyltransferase family 2 protein n=2 Tax=Roseburia porci TaxID=2605790 RepID=A0A6L5YV69_9FIRM|nr:glycosyltransferase family 2 protein [Roseburia porci]